jgi:hypothetical protein
MVQYINKIVGTVNELPPLFTPALKQQAKVGVCVAVALKSVSLLLWYFFAPKAPLLAN